MKRLILCSVSADRSSTLSAHASGTPTEFAYVLDALGHLERTRIYDELGEVDEAMDYYTRFIDLWRDADPPLQPQVEEARQRLAALSS